MSTLFPINQLDGDDYILHHWAAEYHIPFRFLMVINPNKLPIRNLNSQQILSKVDYFRTLWLAGSSLDQISDQLSLNPTDTAMIFAKLSLDRRNDLIKSIGDGLTAGKSSQQIAKELSLTGETVRQVHRYIVISQQEGRSPLVGIPDQLELDIINAYYKKINYGVLGSITILYQNWWRDYKAEANQHFDIIYNLTKIRKDVSQAISLPRSILKVSKISILASPIKNTPDTISARDGLDIFNQSKVSLDLPYLELNYTTGHDQPVTSQSSADEIWPTENPQVEMDKIYKIYYPDPSQISLDYSIIVRANQETKQKNTIKMTVWAENRIGHTIKDSFIPADYDLENNQLQAQIKIKNDQTEQLVKNRISRSFPTIQINDWAESEANGHFKLFGLEIDKFGLLDLVLLDDLFLPYLYVDEKDTPAAIKRTLYFHFRSILDVTDLVQSANRSSVRISYVQHYTKAGQKFIIQGLDGREYEETFPVGTPYVGFSLLKAKNRIEANRIINILSKLFGYYMSPPPPEKSVRIQQIEEYDKYIPELRTSRAKIKMMEQTRPISEKMTKIKHLKTVAPEVFVAGYATNCQSSDQPIPISPDEIPIWIQKKFLHAGVYRERQIMTYPPILNSDPPNIPRWIFVCPDDKVPFPGVKKNNLKNANQYPYLPCCYTKDHMDSTANSDYNRYSKGISPEIIYGKSQPYIKKTNKIINPGSYGLISKNVGQFLSQYETGGTEFRILGMPDNPSSLINCILTALNDIGYLNKISILDKDEYVRNIRRSYLEYIRMGQINPELMKQELFDRSSQQITEGLTNLELFLDPALYYRALEKIYNINIFVFVSKSKNGKSKNGDSKNGFSQLEIPRHRDFYRRTKNLDKNTILIYKHPLSTERSGAIVNARCELIVRKREGANIHLYNPNRDKLAIQGLFELFYRTASSEEWLISTISPDERSLIRKGGLDRISLLSLVPKESITHQVLDDYGKLRGIVFSYPSKSGTSIVMVIPPSQPLNAPLWKRDHLPNLNQVLDFFSEYQVTGASYIDPTRNYLNGIWYGWGDSQFEIYFPIQPISANYPVGPDRPINFNSGEISKSVRIRGLKKLNIMILNIVKWLLVLSGLEVNQFIQTWLINGRETGGDSFNKYNLNQVPHKFPSLADVNQAIRYLSRVTNGLIRQNRVYLYSDKYFKSVSFFLRDYQKNTTGLRIPVPTIISGRLMSVEDFISDPDAIIFMDQDELKNWLESLKRDKEDNLKIKSHIDLEFSSWTHPYIFQGKHRIYLIQNAWSEKEIEIVGSPASTANKISPVGPLLKAPVEPPVTLSVVGDQPNMPTGLLRSLQIGSTWKDSLVNLGYRAEITDIKYPYPPHKIYILSASKVPSLKHDRSNNNTDSLLILKYSTGQYAAMLPISS